MPKTITYQGAHAAVEVRTPDGDRKIVERGGELTTSAAHAKALLAQGENWTEGPAAKPPDDDKE